MNGLIDDPTAENWMALCVSILRGVPPDESFRLLDARKCRRYSEVEMLQIEYMKSQGMRWKDIAYHFGTERSALCHRYHNWKQRRKKAGLY